MRELIKKHGDDKDSIIREYAAAEEKGIVERKRNSCNLTALAYASNFYSYVKQKETRMKSNIDLEVRKVVDSLNIPQSVYSYSVNSNSDLHQCYNEILKIPKLKEKIESFNIKLESIKVIEMVDAYRHYWKPSKVNVVLLAESHVYTQSYELDYIVQMGTANHLNNYHEHFVRFVYCLAYGEKTLLKEKYFPKKDNRGTPDFWKIFLSCCEEITVDKYNSIYDSIKTATTSDIQRIGKKIDILNKMKSKGIWLLDASIVGLYVPGAKRLAGTSMCNKIISCSWQNYVKNKVLQVAPKFIIVIGKGVGKVLKKELDQLVEQKSIEGYETVSLPGDHLPGNGHRDNLMKYYQICKKYC